MRKMRVSVASLLIFLLVFSQLPLYTAVASQLAATDDLTDHWAESTIRQWIATGNIQGYEDGSFKPDQSISRSELVTLIDRLMKPEEGEPAPFSDVQTTYWAHDAISRAVHRGYIEGYEDVTFRAEEPVSRQEAAIIAVRLLNIHTTNASDHQLTFADSSAIPDWSRGAIGLAVEKQIIQGYEDNTFRPEQSLTRAEAVWILERIKGHLIRTYDQAGEYGSTSGSEQIAGDAIVKTANVTLRNTSIAGDLEIAESVGEGEVFLSHVVVEGTLLIRGGGTNSIYLEDSSISKLIVEREEGAVRIVAKGDTVVHQTELLTASQIETDEINEGTDKGFQSIILSEKLPANAQVVLQGFFKQVEVEAAEVELFIPRGRIARLSVSESSAKSIINLAQSVEVAELVLNSPATIKGEGNIEKATLSDKAKDASFETEPHSIERPDNEAAAPIVTNPGGSGGNPPGGSNPGDNDSGNIPDDNSGNDPDDNEQPTQLTASVSVAGFKKLEVVFNVPVDPSKVSLQLIKDDAAILIPMVVPIAAEIYSEDRKSLVVETHISLITGEYTLSIAGVTENPLSYSVAVQEEVISDIQFTLDTAVLQPGFSRWAWTHYKLLNQYGEDATGRFAGRVQFLSNSAHVSVQSSGLLALNFYSSLPTEVKIDGYFGTLGVTKTLEVTETEIPATNDFGSRIANDDRGLYHQDGKRMDVDSDFSEFKYLFKINDAAGSLLPLEQIADRVQIVIGTPSLEAARDSVTDKVLLEYLEVDGSRWAAFTLRKATDFPVSVVAGTYRVYVVDSETDNQVVGEIKVWDRSKVDTIELQIPDNVVAGEKIAIPFTAKDQFGEPVSDARVIANGFTSTSLTYGRIVFEGETIYLDLADVAVDKAQYLLINWRTETYKLASVRTVLQPDADSTEPVEIPPQQPPVEQTVARLELQAPQFVVAGETTRLPFKAYDKTGRELTSYDDLAREVMFSSNFGQVYMERDYLTGQAHLIYEASIGNLLITVNPDTAVTLVAYNQSGVLATLNFYVSPEARPVVITSVDRLPDNILAGDMIAIHRNYIRVLDQYGRSYSLAHSPIQYQVMVTGGDNNLISITNPVLGGYYAQPIVLDALRKGTSEIQFTLVANEYDITVPIVKSHYTAVINVVDTEQLTEYTASINGGLYAASPYESPEVIASKYGKAVTITGLLEDGQQVWVPHSNIINAVTESTYLHFDQVTGTIWATEGIDLEGSSSKTFNVTFTLPSSNGTSELVLPVTVSNEFPMVSQISLRTSQEWIRETENIVSVPVHVLHYSGIQTFHEPLLVRDQYNNIMHHPNLWFTVTDLSPGKTLENLHTGDSFNVTATANNETSFTFKVIVRP